MQAAIERCRSFDSRLVLWDKLSRTVGEGQMVWVPKNEMRLLWQWWREVRYVVVEGGALGEYMERRSYRAAVARLGYWSMRLRFLFDGWRKASDCKGWMVGHEVVRSVKLTRRVMLLFETALVNVSGGPGAEEDKGLGEASGVGEQTDVDLDKGSN